MSSPTRSQARLPLRFLARFPLTLFGTLLLLASMTLLGTALVRSDALAAAAGFLALALTVFAAVIPRFISADAVMDDLMWDSSADLSAGSSGASAASAHSLRLKRWTLPPFYRLHARISSRLCAGDRLLYRSRREYRLEDDQSLELPTTPPLPGILFQHGEFRLTDVFGIGCRWLGEVRDRQCAVLPPRLPPGDLRYIESRTSEEDNSRAKKSDQEKIFVRDYQNDDLARDINWKASGRINKLLTRIPPESEAKTRLIRVMVLSESGELGDRAGFQLQLAAVKSAVAGFLEEIRKRHGGYRVVLYFNGEQRELNDEDDFDRGLRALAAWHPPHKLETSELPILDSALTVFSHSLFAPLPTALRGYPPEDISLFIVQGTGDPEEADLRLSYLPPEPGPGQFIPAIKPMSMNAPPLRISGQQYGMIREVRLNCRW
jgi:uncharacterized protein (DUF58 family)